MTRSKVKLAFIANDSARKATFKKRKIGLMKKAAELSTLCGIQACAVIYSPYESQPEFWPSLVEARQIAAKFKELPEMEQTKKMVNHDSYLREQILKATNQLKKLKKENRENYITQVMFQCITGNSLHHQTMADLSDLELVIDQHRKDIDHQMDNLKRMSGMVHNRPNMNVGTSNVLDHHQLACGSLDYPIHESNLEASMHGHQQQQPGNWFVDPMNSQIGSHGHGGLGVGGVLGDEMMLPFGNTNNIHLNSFHWSGGFFH